MTSPKHLARIAGVLYLLVGVFGGFAEGVVEPRMYVAGNAVATTANVIANTGLVRLGIVADLVDQTLFVFLVLTLYTLLREIHQSVARSMVIFVVLASGITCLNTVFEVEGLRVATGAVNLGAGSTAGMQSQVLLLLDAQHYGIFIAQIFFGLWLVPLGYLAYRSSGMFPRWLGVLLIAGGISYLVEVLAVFLAPDAVQRITSMVVILSAIAELCMVGYLLVIGVHTKPGVKTGEHILSEA